MNGRKLVIAATTPSPVFALASPPPPSTNPTRSPSLLSHFEFEFIHFFLDVCPSIEPQRLGRVPTQIDGIVHH